MLKKAVGIVIRRVAYGDNHLIITFLNEAGVKVALMARNARKSTKYGAGLDLFYENLFIFSQFKGMGTLSSVDTINSHYAIREDIYKLTYAQYTVELIDRALEEGESNPYAYKLLKSALSHMNDSDNARIIAMLISLKCMPLYGYVPNFKYSTFDGNMTHKDFTAYSFKFNSVVTNEALIDDPHAIRMSNKSLYLLFMMSEVPIENLSSINIDGVLIDEMESLIFKMYDEFIGVYIKSRKIMEQMRRLDQTKK